MLAHELQHAAGTAAGDLPDSPVQCLRFEADAFSRESTIWMELWDNNLPADVDDIHAELNAVTRSITQDPQAFAAKLAQLYGADCGLAAQ